MKNENDKSTKDSIEVITKDNINAAIKKEIGPLMQELNDKQNRYEGLKKKKLDTTASKEVLRLEIKKPFDNLDDVDLIIKNRRCSEKEIEEIDEILITIDTFLTAAKDETRVIAEKISGIILSVFVQLHSQEQMKINSLLDSVNLITEEFNKVTCEVPILFLGNSLHEFSLDETIRALNRQFDFSRAPDNGSGSSIVGGLMRLANL